MSPSLRAEYLQKCFGVFLHRDLSIFCHLIFIQLFSYISVDSWVFITLGCIPLLFYLFAQIILTFPIGSSFSWFLYRFDILISFWNFFGALSYFSGFWVILYIFCHNVRIRQFFQKPPSLLYWIKKLEIRILDTSYVYCSLGVIVSTPSQLLEQGDICV